MYWKCKRSRSIGNRTPSTRRIARSMASTAKFKIELDPYWWYRECNWYPLAAAKRWLLFFPQSNSTGYSRSIGNRAPSTRIARSMASKAKFKIKLDPYWCYRECNWYPLAAAKRWLLFSKGSNSTWDTWSLAFTSIHMGIAPSRVVVKA
jgi:phage gpG-like protein